MGLLDFTEIQEQEETIEQLVARLQSDPTRADFAKLYNIFKDKVYSKCVYFVKERDEAADLSELVWIKVNNKLDTFECRSSFATWLFRLATNECLNYMTESKRPALRFESIDVESFEEKYDPNDTTGQDRLFAELDVTKALLGLSKESRALIILKNFDNYTYEEIASKTKLSPSAVKMKISRAKKKLLDELTY